VGCIVVKENRHGRKSEERKGTSKATDERINGQEDNSKEDERQCRDCEDGIPRRDREPGVSVLESARRAEWSGLAGLATRGTRVNIGVKRILGSVAIGLIAALALVYVCDYAVWRVRVATGGGMGSVVVSSIVVMPLKGNKEEYDWAGTSEVSCSRSIFPQAGSGSCWWLRRHNVIFER
jgi:hypothetical protein